MANPPHMQPQAYGQPKPIPWPLIITGVLGFVVLVGIALTVTGGVGGSRSSNGSASRISQYGSSTPPAPRPITMPNNALYFFGTWGPNCPQSTADAMTFFSDGTFQAPGGFGTWTIDAGSTITMTGNGRTVSSEWVFSSGNAAVAYGMGTPGGQPVRRCG
jgi:hypothetical protein